MDFGIKDRTAIVTAAGGGLGTAITHALVAEGVRVAACDIDEAGLADTVSTSQHPDRVFPYALDLSDHQAISDTVAAVQAELGNVSILVNISGGPPPTPATETQISEWEKYFHSMVSSAIHLTNTVLPGMREQQWGRIITSTSSGVITPIPNLAISNGLRTALVGWSKTLASEVGQNNITANVLVPGRIATARIEALDEAKAARQSLPVADVAKESVSKIPLGRYGKPTEYAAAAAFLASEAASYITGTVIRVDGGLIPSL